MVNDLITLKSGKVNEYLHHIDVKAYGRPRMLSVFLCEFDENESILIDCGSSLDIKSGLKYFKKNDIKLSSFKHIIPTHHHFDHIGGAWKLYEEIKKYNPNVKILTNQITKELLNDFKLHLQRGMRTYGNLVGVMKPISDEAFKIIEPIQNFNIKAINLEVIDKFHVNGSEVKLAIFKTPGHTPDHQCPALIKDGSIDFIQYGESAGTIYHESKLLSMPTSMPIYYNHEKYMEILDKLIDSIPLNAGFAHFGLVSGKNSIKELLTEHRTFMKQFREEIIQFYSEKPETKYVLNKVSPLLFTRTDLSMEHNPVLNGISLGIVYGMMTSLGYRKIPEEELSYYNKFYSSI
ncbi:MAG: MBL fold metallo-hydrolase [Promethearchaeota archaeon]|jgi:glyoxylase-like metal-dependent hydrolase (beta-lactamase superfamily II)